MLPAVMVPPLRLMDPVPAVAVTVPPAVFAILAGSATTKPAGKLLLNASAVASAVLFELSMVKVSVTVSPCAIGSVANALLNPGGGLTRRVALAVPLLPRLEVRSPVMLVKSPELLAVTSTESVAVLPAVIVPAVRLIESDPAVAVMVPPAVFATLAGFAITRPAGRVFVNARAVASTGLLELSMVNVSVTVSPVVIGSVANAWLKSGCGMTLSVSLAVPLLPRLEVSSSVRLVKSPKPLAVTSTEMVDVVFAATVPPE